MADEEYLTISSSLEPQHRLASSIAFHTASNSAAISSESPDSSSVHSSHTQNVVSHTSGVNIPSLGFSSDTPTTCPLSHPSQPLTTQPPKAKHHSIQQGLHPGHYKPMSKNSRPVAPPPQPPAPPATPITAQVTSTVPPCASPPALLPPPPVPREALEKREKEYKDDDDIDEEEEESRRKVCLSYDHLSIE